MEHIENANQADGAAYAQHDMTAANALEWARMQPKMQNYYISDIVQFHGGGVGVITCVSKNDDWPPSYSTEPIRGYAYRPDGKLAWHYEGDIKSLVARHGVIQLFIPNDKECRA